MTRLVAVYRVRADAATIEARARAIAVEQSVEMPLAYIRDKRVLDEIVGRVEGIRDLEQGVYEARIGLCVATMGADCAQVLNMVYGNSSMHEGVELAGLELPPGFAGLFGGPRHGIAGWRALAGAPARALSCTALKPQGAPLAFLAKLAGDFARGRLDFVKDDHGLADQEYSPFAARVGACAQAVRQANRETGGRTRYVPSVTGDLDAMHRHMAIVRDEGIEAVLVAPMVVGLPSFHALAKTYPDILLMAHPSFAGGGRVAPALLIGTLFRLFGADATIFVNHGGRFAYAPATCRALAHAAREDLDGLKPAMPVPAGGMTVERVEEMLDFYGLDTMLLIGGALMADLDRIAEAGAAFQRRVEAASAERAGAGR